MKHERAQVKSYLGEKQFKLQKCSSVSSSLSKCPTQHYLSIVKIRTSLTATSAAGHSGEDDQKINESDDCILYPFSFSRCGGQISIVALITQFIKLQTFMISRSASGHF